MRKRILATLLIALWLIALPGVPAARADQTVTPQPGAELFDLAKRKGPILWHYGDDIRQTMENDLELLRLFNEASAAKKRRKAIGLGLFIPGVILFGGGLFAGVFQHALGLFDDQYGDYIMVTGVTIGAGLIAPAVYLTGWESAAEKRYKKYMKDSYGVTPIMRLVPQPGGALAQFGVLF